MLCEEEQIVFAVNGEILNHAQLRRTYASKYKFKSSSDSEIIGFLYNYFQGDPQFLQMLEGMWALIIYDIKKNTFLIAKDHVGIIPLYYGLGLKGEIYVSSEMKTISDHCKFIELVYPGHYLTNSMVQTKWYSPLWHNNLKIPESEVNLTELQNNLINAIRENLHGDVPFGILISGGIDSSLIAAITKRLIDSNIIDLKHKKMKEIHTFCIGLKNSGDLQASRKVAEYLGTNHHEIIYEKKEAFDCLEQVIYHTETFVPLLVAGCVPMYLLAKKIKELELGIKFVLAGEGADELFGGYSSFYYAPNPEEFHKELIKKINNLYKFDLLRANKAFMAHGIELRPPFLHKPFVEYIMQIAPQYKMPMNNTLNIEKYILR